VKLPDNSNIRLEFSDISESRANIFPGSTLSPLPFSVDVTDVDILLGLAFKPTIPVGFEFSDKLKAEVFVSMNLPRLDAKLSTNAPANCGNSTNATTPAAPFANSTTGSIGDLATLGPLVLVEANISVTVDVGIDVSLPLLPPPFGEVGIEANIFSVSFPLVTACVNSNDTLPSITATVTAMPTPGNVTATTTVYKTAKVTQTSVIRATKSWSNHTVTSTIVDKEQVVPVETLSSLPLVQLSSASNVTATSVLPAGNISFALTPESAIPTPPRTAVFTSSGSLNPSNTTIAPALTPAQQTGIAFTGAAAPGAEMPHLRWAILGWHSVMVGSSIIFGAMLLI